MIKKGLCKINAGRSLLNLASVGKSVSSGLETLTGVIFSLTSLQIRNLEEPLFGWTNEVSLASGKY